MTTIEIILGVLLVLQIIVSYIENQMWKSHVRAIIAVHHLMQRELLASLSPVCDCEQDEDEEEHWGNN